MSPREHGERNLSLDAMRVIAASAIAVAHAAGYYLYGSLKTDMFFVSTVARAAVPFFFFAAGWGYARSYAHRGPSALPRRLMRLGIPFVFWWIVSVLAMQGLTAAFTGSWQQALSTTVYAWPVYSLWFFPAALLLTLITHVVLRGGILIPGLVIAWIVFLGAVAVTWLRPDAYTGLVEQITVLDPEMALYKSPFFWTGATLTGAWAAGKARALSRPLVGALWALVGTALALIAGAYYDTTVLAPLLGNAMWLTCLYTAVGVGTGLLAVERATPRFLDPLAPLAVASLGVYAIHPLVIDVALRLTEPELIANTMPFYAFFALVLGATWAAALLGRRIPLVGKWLF